MPVSALRFPYLRLLLLVCVTTTVTTLISGTDHTVGANRGWNPGINYTLWYQKNQYNVFEVNETDYDNCTTYGAVGNWSSGEDFIPLDKAKRYYFMCPNGCYNGMKVSVLVHPIPSCRQLPFLLTIHHPMTAPAKMSSGWDCRFWGLCWFRLPPSGSESNWVQLV
uniref:Phytocyanin domain-containing protein n=1 Tax=Nelumbo nucifera TaxID=4432 RepID=A0A822YIT4_NELNU|nr:TPA_asm: hypothetical protein HUJ06_011253 [Nelumbo nucifera]